MTYLELHEPRLAVCELSWGACALLSRYANNAAAHHAKKLARPVAAGQSPAVAPPLPPPPPLPTQPLQLGRDRSAHAVGGAARPPTASPSPVAHATTPRPQAAVFASA
eukprot:TRINITY_DN817_c0_g1_i18.p4 TRINITY_DN817_c0_g1~~TRINITY_DN817_c0_g1_i18.p4  ORF type:complete len:108 (+),score=13.05 TRINITY_DN817_c0_g1_i18:603-926(+)